MAAAEATGGRKSDLGVRTTSAAVMVALAGTALWFGGWVWSVFVFAVALGVLWEWRCLAAGFTSNPSGRGLWNAAGIVYIGFAAAVMVILRSGADGLVAVLQIVSAVIATDVGAYLTGRTFGGPKIAPRISPSKTWSGFFGGTVAAGVVMALWGMRAAAATQPGLTGFDGGVTMYPATPGPAVYAAGGALIAVVSQAGDFFQSWMKRRAGVKDSGRLIPGHGGVFDRFDGTLAVFSVLGILMLLSGGFGGIA